MFVIAGRRVEARSRESKAVAERDRHGSRRVPQAPDQRAFSDAARGNARQIARSFRGTFWALLTPGLILAGILTGVATPTEAGVVAAVYTLAASAGVYQTISFRNLRQSLEIAMLSTARVMYVLAAAVL